MTVLLALHTAASAGAQALPQVIHPDGYGDRAQGATAKRSRNGYFYFNATINGAALNFIVDTGATSIVIRAEDAAKIGIDVDRLNYNGVATTANGPTKVAPVLLDTVTVGGITRRNVAAIVGQPGRLTDNLLGQSFTARLAGVRIEGDVMRLQGE